MIHHGDCLDILPTLDDHVDAVVTDPPYGMSFMGKGWDHAVPGVPYWTAIRDVMHPGAHLLAFGGTRTFHRMAVAIEDAGFEIKDTLAWLYGSGFPKHKSLLKPAYEPIILARKPGKGVLQIDACRLESPGRSFWNGTGRHGGQFGGGGVTSHERGEWTPASGRWPPNVCMDTWDEPVARLRYNIPDDIGRVIREFYRDYRRVQAVSEAYRGAPESQDSQEILQSRVLLDVAQREPARRSPSDVRQEAHPGIHRQDGDPEAGDGKERPGRLQLEGREVRLSGIRDDYSLGVATSGTGNVQVDGEPQQREINPRTSPSDGAPTGTAADPLRNRSPQERNQERQPARKPRTDRERRSQEVTSGNSPRIEAVASRERSPVAPALLVLDCDIPPGWRHYFEPTGLTIPSPDSAAAMLDAQSGERPSGGGNRSPNGRPGLRGNLIRPKGKAGDRAPDTGGASRYFYVAKASRSERNAGLEGMPERVGDKTIRNGVCAHCGKVWIDGRREGPCCDTPQRTDASVHSAANFHPTVKPLELCRWLVRLVTPPGGIVLDPFMGSGTTGCAAVMEGLRFIGIEREAEYVEIAERRIAYWARQGRQLDMVAD